MLNNIPEELKKLPQWVCWRYVEETKVPYTPYGTMASVTDSTTWSTFEACAGTTGFNGIGFVLSEEDPYSIIDLDNKPSKPCTPEQLERHTKIYNAFESYTEMSTSGTGVHIIVRGRIPSGIHRDNVEVYSDRRYMICTGHVLRNLPIKDYQELLTQMYGEMRPATTTQLDDVQGDKSDEEVVAIAMRAANAGKFASLCRGETLGYPSQSEADEALMSIIAFYTKDNEQVRRIFRTTNLGKREKAIKNDTYLNFTLRKIRANEPPKMDAEQMKANVAALLSKKPPEPAKPPPPHKPMPEVTPAPLSSVKLPPGLIGELAQYFYSAAIRPVPEIALAAAIALVAGVAGRAFNISGSGLNQYIILLAKTGSGKEGALSGMENLLAEVKLKVPQADSFMGPAAFASGQALVRMLDTKPSFVSVLGEFGLTLQQLSDAKASSAQMMLRKVLLDIYAKSGWKRTLRASVYSDQEKNTKDVQAPNVTILGESTPETFFDGLDASHIAEGLIPRFSVIEYTGDRPHRNRNPNCPPSAGLVQRFCDLTTISLTNQNAARLCTQVELDSHSADLLDDFDALADKTMNSSRMEVEVQVWNRAHLKALKLAALVAVGVNPHQPVVTADMAQWAIDFVTRDVKLVSARFKKGDVGQGDSKQYHDVRRAVQAFFEMTGEDEWAKLRQAHILPYKYMLRRTANMSSLRNDRLGATGALKRTLQSMVESGELGELSKLELASKFSFSGIAYSIGGHWK